MSDDEDNLGNAIFGTFYGALNALNKENHPQKA